MIAVRDGGSTNTHEEIVVFHNRFAGLRHARGTS